MELGVSQFVAGDLDAARDSFREAAQLDPRNPNSLLGMARIYKAKGCYIHAFMFARSAVSNAIQEQHRSYAHSLLGGIYYKLFIHTHRITYAEEAINLYIQAQHELPTDALPVWNYIDTCICIYRNVDNLTEAQRQYYLEQARSKVSQLRDIATMPESNFARYKERIINDAERVFDGLGPWWDDLLDDLKNWGA